MFNYDELGKLAKENEIKKIESKDKVQLSILLLLRLQVNQKCKGFKNVIRVFDSGVDH